MDRLIFYFDDLSQPCRALEIFLKINNIPCTLKRVNLAAGEHYQEVFRNINPFSKVPVIDDNGFILTESVAIIRYLVRERKIADHWYPRDSKLRARVDEYLEWQHNETRLNCALYFRLTVLQPMLTDIPPSTSLVTTLKKRVVQVCDKINNIWLKGDKKFIAGDDITVADLFAVAELDELKLTDYDPREGRQALANWMDRVQETTNPYYDQVNARLIRIAKKFSERQRNIETIAKL